MKKLLLILVALLWTVSAYTQTEKGRMFIGGSLGVSGSSNSYVDTLNNQKINSWRVQVNPGFGGFIKNNLAIGANLNFGINNYTQKYEYALGRYEQTLKDNSLNIGAEAFIQYYKKIVPNFFVFIRGSLAYNHEAEKREVSTTDPYYVYTINDPAVQHIAGNDISINFTPGLVYFITPKLGIQATFGNLYYKYSMSKNTSLPYEHNNSSSSFALNLNPSTFSLGLNYYFK